MGSAMLNETFRYLRVLLQGIYTERAGRVVIVSCHPSKLCLHFLDVDLLAWFYYWTMVHCLSKYLNVIRQTREATPFGSPSNCVSYNELKQGIHLADILRGLIQ